MLVDVCGPSTFLETVTAIPPIVTVVSAAKPAPRIVTVAPPVVDNVEGDTDDTASAPVTGVVGVVPHATAKTIGRTMRIRRTRRVVYCFRILPEKLFGVWITRVWPLRPRTVEVGSPAKSLVQSFHWPF